MKRTIGFRFSDEVIERLGALALEQGKTRTAVLEGLVLGASVSVVVERTAEVTPAPDYSKVQATGGVSTVRTDPKPVDEKPAPKKPTSFVPGQGIVSGALSTARSGKKASSQDMLLSKAKWK